MAIRWRKSGELLCAAKHDEKPGDTYIGDRLQYELAVEHKVIIPDANESLSGVHHWIKDVFPVAEGCDDCRIKGGCWAKGEKCNDFVAIDFDNKP